MKRRCGLYQLLMLALTAAQCQGCEQFWIRCPGNIAVLEGTDARFEWSHNISGEVEIRWLHDGHVVMDYSGGALVLPESRADYLKYVPRSATMILKNVTSADTGRYETRVVNPAAKTHHPSEGFMTVIHGADLVVRIEVDGVVYPWSIDKNGTNIILPKHRQVSKRLQLEVNVSETAPTPAVISVNLHDKDGQSLNGDPFCTQTKTCSRQLEVHSSPIDTLDILVDFDIQNMDKIHVRQIFDETTEENKDRVELPQSTQGSRDDVYEPIIHINNRVTNNGARLDLAAITHASVVVTTDEPANITVKYHDILTTCTGEKLCSSIVELSDPQGNITVHITVSYNDHVYQGAVIILTTPDVPVEKSASPKTTAIITLIVVGFLIIVVAVLVVMRKKIWKRRSPDMEGEEKKYSCYPSVESVEKQDDGRTVPHSDTTEQLITEDDFYGQSAESPSESHVAVQCQNQSLFEKFVANVQGILPSRPTAPSVSYTVEQTPEGESLRSTESRTGDLELPGTHETEPEYQADTQGTGTLMKQTGRIASGTEDRIRDIRKQVYIRKELYEDGKFKRKAQTKLLAAAKRGNAKSKRGKITVQKDKDSTAADGQLESDQTPEPVADEPPASLSLTSEITPGTGPLADPDDWVDPPSAVAEILPDEGVNMPSAKPENQTNVAVVKPQTATAEAERSDNNPYKGAYFDQKQNEQIVPLLFSHGVS